MVLNDAYEPTRWHIIYLKPIPSIEDMFNLVAQDERQKSITPAPPTNVVFQTSGPDDKHVTENTIDHSAFAAAHNNSGYRLKQRPLCTYCGQF